MCDFSGETFKGFQVLLFSMIATTTQQLSSGKFCKLRYDAVPVSASLNVSFYTNNSKMPYFELWHSCRKWAICLMGQCIPIWLFKTDPTLLLDCIYAMWRCLTDIKFYPHWPQGCTSLVNVVKVSTMGRSLVHSGPTKRGCVCVLVCVCVCWCVCVCVCVCVCWCVCLSVWVHQVQQ